MTLAEQKRVATEAHKSGYQYAHIAPQDWLRLIALAEAGIRTYKAPGDPTTRAGMAEFMAACDEMDLALAAMEES